MRVSRGQVGVEYILLTGLLLLLLTPFLYEGYRSSGEATRLLQGEKIVNDLAQAADYVYAQGVGARVTVTGTIPGGVNFDKSYIGRPANASTSVEPREINLNLQVSEGDNDIWKSTDADLCPDSTWPQFQRGGSVVFTLTVEDSGCVSVKPFETGFVVTPPLIVTDCITNTHSKQYNLTIENVGESATIINITTEGDAASWVVPSTNQVTLSTGSSTTMGITITVPSAASQGYHYVKVFFEANDSTFQEVNTQILVCSQGNGSCTNQTGNCTNCCDFNYTVTTYSDDACTVPEDTFYKPSPTQFVSNGWQPNSTLSLDIRNIATNNSLSGYPTNITADTSGSVIYNFDPAYKPAADYMVYITDGNYTRNNTMEINACPT